MLQRIPRVTPLRRNQSGAASQVQRQLGVALMTHGSPDAPDAHEGRKPAGAQGGHWGCQEEEDLKGDDRDPLVIVLVCEGPRGARLFSGQVAHSVTTPRQHNTNDIKSRLK
ncbi:hypothetical protein VOLCADRAFT_96467 [Volvox carteri f. nagariensis]|uniref:Uncharacterized protein n=1 Tax=Volvox carteri f. nagariensis TaxID=3068 RepID=D8UA68_VOLCA|nr:uncharacterized protein VOLCADRAFT_96467 [Volvox carteri f. nagariensis]EFJ43420.1 hypothetical protein VOLCADRAFT_96467 [Volvox carteri f. nagariensis]|eukprot:XP_002955567.1 hypothetical protein VOLCADRAFT_96467 [Volvox carteri f. nagariensis]